MADNFDVLRAGIRLLRRGVTHYDKREVVDRTEKTLLRCIDEIERDFKQLKEDYMAQIQFGSDAP